MRRIDLNRLVPGRALPFTLFDARGRTVFEQGRMLRPHDVKRLRRAYREGLYIDDGTRSAGDHPRSAGGPAISARRLRPIRPVRGDDTQTPRRPRTQSNSVNDGRQTGANQVHISWLVPGMQLPHSIYDERGVMLLAGGSTITPGFLDKIKARGITQVFTRDQRKAAGATGLSPRQGAEAQTDEATPRTDERSPASQSSRRRRSGPARMPLAQLRQRAIEGRAAVERAVQSHEAMVKGVRDGRRIDMDQVRNLLQQLRRFVMEDPSLPGLILDFRARAGEYLFRHGVHASVLTMSLASRLGFDEHDVASAGTGALLQDLGMLDVPDAVRMAPRRLSGQERLEIERHPVYTINTLERQGVTHPTVRMVCYQVHERCNRTGYPRQRHRMFIHPLARLAAAVDVFSALTCDRPHRPRYGPYEGMTLMLHLVKAGQLDAEMVRAMLDELSLFPVGSLVKLSNDMTARVVRAVPGQHTRPIVTPVNMHGEESDTEIDLSREGNLRVVRAISDPDVSTINHQVLRMSLNRGQRPVAA